MNNDIFNSKVNSVKDQIINTSLIVGSFIGLLSFITCLEFNIQNNYYVFISLDLLVVISLISLAILRKRISTPIKALFIIMGLFIVSLGSVVKVGLFADSKVLLLLIPVFAFLGYSFRNTMYIYLLAIVIFSITGYLYISGKIISHVDLQSRALNTSAWINNVLLLSIIAFIITAIVRKFYKTFWNLVSNLEGKNRELGIYHNKLELMVKMRTKELETANKKLQASINENKVTIGKLKETQANLIQSEKMASVGLLASGVAHEINNPLNFIQGGVLEIEYFLNHNLNKQQLVNIEPYINGVKEGVKRSSDIVASLSQFSRSTDTLAESCHLHNVIDNCLTMLNNNIKHRIKVNKHYAKAPIFINFNNGKLHQIMLNVLLNAEQAIPEKGKISISTEQKNDHAIITILDSGIGIQEDIMSKISDPFFTTKEVGKGTGLGLSIVCKIIKEHKGTIQFDSEVNKGTKVIITLPLDE